MALVISHIIENQYEWEMFSTLILQPLKLNLGLWDVHTFSW